MTDATIKQLASDSYSGKDLNENVVEKIGEKLNRRDLKKYIAYLKSAEKKKEVYVTSAQKLSVKDLDKVQQLFPAKTLVFTVDKEMISGVKIVENDTEYEINLNRTFHDIMRFLSTND